MRKRYGNDVIVIVAAFSNAIIVIFVDLSDDVCAKSSTRQIIASAFKHVLALLLIIINHKYDSNLVISLYIKSSSYF